MTFQCIFMIAVCFIGCYAEETESPNEQSNSTQYKQYVTDLLNGPSLTETLGKDKRKDRLVCWKSEKTGDSAEGFQNTVTYMKTDSAGHMKNGEWRRRSATWSFEEKDNKLTLLLDALTPDGQKDMDVSAYYDIKYANAGCFVMATTQDTKVATKQSQELTVQVVRENSRCLLWVREERTEKEYNGCTKAFWSECKDYGGKDFRYNEEKCIFPTQS